MEWCFDQYYESCFAYCDVSSAAAIDELPVMAHCLRTSTKTYTSWDMIYRMRLYFYGCKFPWILWSLSHLRNNIFVNPWKFFTLWIHENFNCSVSALLAQWSISFKALPYSLPPDDGAIKMCTISLFFITETAKRL